MWQMQQRRMPSGCSCMAPQPGGSPKAAMWAPVGARPLPASPWSGSFLESVNWVPCTA